MRENEGNAGCQVSPGASGHTVETLQCSGSHSRRAWITSGGGLLRNSRGQENCGQKVQGSGAAAAGQNCALPAQVSQDWQAEESQDGGGKDHGRENSLRKQ